MKFSLLLVLVSFNVFSDDLGLHCKTEFRELKSAQGSLTKSTDQVAAFSKDQAKYTLAIASELIAQSNRQVGSYGYSVKQQGETALRFSESYLQAAKSSEEKVSQAMNALEDCLDKE